MCSSCATNYVYIHPQANVPYAARPNRLLESICAFLGGRHSDLKACTTLAEIDSSTARTYTEGEFL